MIEIYKKISAVVSAYINTMPYNKQEVIYVALNHLLGTRISFYDFTTSDLTKNHTDLQNDLFKLNEKSEQRKNKGVYYTPEDVCKYIIWNSIIMMIEPDNSRTYKENDAINKMSTYSPDIITALLTKKKFFDPTCGSGEFLINVFKAKYSILQFTTKKYTDSEIYHITKTIYGNDIDENSTDISKIRLFFEICQYVSNPQYYSLIAKALNEQFTNVDYVIYDGRFDNTFDCVVGNPPYVEYGKFEEKDSLQNNYGNIYADVIKNSITTLKRAGVFGFIIPLSYISTSRMVSIRNYVIETTDRQFILNFGDRPDCLFQGVHQKLNILIGRKGRQEHRLFTSNYKHWYKEERKSLLNGCEIKENHHSNNAFIPKIGNDIEESIYRKITTSTQNNLFEQQTENGSPLYLNMRACFWIKAFTFNPGSNEYKAFKYDERYSYIHCILNSSIFWLYWTIMSDCWHITTKELKGFYLPTITAEDYKDFEILSKTLENKLESTKKYIGTKQVDYEYKHKDCKDEIDKIDERLAQIYELTKEEIHYIKNYALKYRLGSGADGKND